MAVPDGTAPRDVAVDVKPRRIRVAARGATLLEGPLGGEVRAADGPGDWEWELADADGDAEAGKHVAITLTKKCAPPAKGTCSSCLRCIRANASRRLAALQDCEL